MAVQADPGCTDRKRRLLLPEKRSVAAHHFITQASAADLHRRRDVWNLYGHRDRDVRIGQLDFFAGQTPQKTRPGIQKRRCLTKKQEAPVFFPPAVLNAKAAGGEITDE